MTAAEHPSNALVTEHMAMVGYQVNALMARLPPHVYRDDLVSAGHLALIRAARSYNASTGVPFARWAALRIRGALIDELRGQDWATRQERQRATRVTTVSNELASALGHTPSLQEMADHTGMSVEEVSNARAAAQVRVVSIDAGGDDSSVAATIRDETLGPEDLVLADEREQYLRAAVAALPDKLRTLIEGLFFYDRTMIEMAEEMGVTQSRISQLRTEAMALMRDGINASLDPELVDAPEKPDGVAQRRRQAYYARVAASAAGTAAASVPTQRGPASTAGRAVAS